MYMEVTNKLLKKQIAYHEYVIKGIFSTTFMNSQLWLPT